MSRLVNAVLLATAHPNVMELETNASAQHSMPSLPDDHAIIRDNNILGRPMSSSVGSLFRLHQHAAQPDVVLSQDRDAYYADSMIGESAAELMETLLGSRRATILAPELKALASCLYFGLTNFVGKQTLGQEYCDIALRRGGGGWSSIPYGEIGRPLSSEALRLYTLIRVGVPYLQERMREGWHGLRSLRDPFGRGGAATLAAARVRARARAAALTPPVGIGIARSSSDRNERRAAVVVTASSPEPTSRAVTAEVVTDAATEGGRNVSGRSRTISPSTNTLVEQSNPSLSSHEVRARVLSRTRGASALASAVVAYLGRVLAWVRRKRPALSGIFEWLLRLHLTVFYFDGQYPSLAMRAVGARLMYTREQDEPRARYAILGLFSLLQAIGEVAAAASATFSRGGDGGGVAGTRAAVSGDAADGGAGADVDAASARVPSFTLERTPADAALYPRSRRKCSLCMSPRENAAATPCGHLFCWECIVGWCQTNPECPLCRQPATPQSIVCVYQYA